MHFLGCGSEGVNQRSSDVTRTQSQRPVSPTVTLTLHASKYKVHNYLKSTKSTMAGKAAQFGLEDAHIQTRPHSTHILLTFKLQSPPTERFSDSCLFNAFIRGGRNINHVCPISKRIQLSVGLDYVF